MLCNEAKLIYGATKFNNAYVNENHNSSALYVYRKRAWTKNRVLWQLWCLYMTQKKSPYPGVQVIDNCTFSKYRDWVSLVLNIERNVIPHYHWLGTMIMGANAIHQFVHACKLCELEPCQPGITLTRFIGFEMISSNARTSDNWDDCRGLSGIGSQAVAWLTACDYSGTWLDNQKTTSAHNYPPLPFFASIYVLA